MSNKLLDQLSRSEVREIALQTGRPACALIGDAYQRLTSQALTEDDIIGLLASMSGREHLLGLPDGRTWKHEANVGLVRVRAAYSGTVLKATMRLISHAEQQPAAKSPAPAPPTTQRRASKRPAAPKVSEPPPPTTQRRASKRPPVYTLELSEPPAALEQQTARVQRPAAAAPPARAASAPARFSTAPVRPPSGPANVSAFPTADERMPSGPVVNSIGDAFNFEPAGKPWLGASVPKQAAAEQAAPVLPKFDGDALDDLFGKAREHRATDLHVLADRPPMLRIAGELVQLDYVVSAAQAEGLILARVPAAALRTLERDGSCDFAMIHPAYGRFRANVTRQRTGIKLTARPIGDRIPTLAELGLPESIGKATDHHNGLIVITGPTGHGKTTTLNAIVGIINRETRKHVITVEDPVEYVHPKDQAVISQREVGTHTKSFEAALKGSLREDPDVIVVGELRDTETVRMALSASETGHLVISTMNTPSAAKTIDRLIDLFPPGDQPQVRMTLAGGLRLIVSQRLLPNADRTGLCAAAEILPGNMPLWNLIRENRTYQIASIQQRGKGLGIVRLDESLAQLVRSGRTTMEHARPLAEAPDQLEALVAGRPLIQRPAEPPPNATAQRANQAAKAAGAAAGAAAAASSKKAAEMGKSMLSRAGKLFGNDQ